MSKQTNADEPVSAPDLSSLGKSARPHSHEIQAEMRADLADLETKYGILSDSAVGIRQDRDARG
jgi:hypothetical protein